MRIKKHIISFALLVILLITGLNAQENFKYLNTDYKFHDVTEISMIVTNYGCTTTEYISGFPSVNFCNYPKGSLQNMIHHFGFWIGAEIKNKPYVTTSADYEASAAQSRGNRFEFWPRFNDKDTIYEASLFDEYPETAAPGIFFNPDGTLSEDYLPISEMDLICQYWDNKVTWDNTNDLPETMESHIPMNLHVIQRFYGFTFDTYKKIIFIDYFMINEGSDPYKNIHFGLYTDPHIGPNWTLGNRGGDDYALFNKKRNLLINADGPKGTEGPPLNDAMIGYRLIDAPINPSDPTVTHNFKHWIHSEDCINDKDAFLRLSDPAIDEDMNPNTPHGSSLRTFSGSGPYGDLMPGDTAKFTVAVIVGDGIEELFSNADYAVALKEKGYFVPLPPPAPKLKAERFNKKVKLNWEWDSEYSGTNPEEFEDKSRGDFLEDFDGYRVYRSTIGPFGPWSKIAEFDYVNGDNFDTGIEYEFTDVGLINGVRYWYSVTAFDRPENLASGDNIPSQESSIEKSVVEVIPAPSPEEGEDKVFVVPNPYRTDVDYTQGVRWEYPTQNRKEWFEIDRRIAFMNLPDQCTISIYTVAGQKVKDIEHSGSSIEYWNLLNGNNHAVSTGLYYFSVIGSNGFKQIGKFVIIK